MSESQGLCIPIFVMHLAYRALEAGIRGRRFWGVSGDIWGPVSDAVLRGRRGRWFFNIVKSIYNNIYIYLCLYSCICLYKIFTVSEVDWNIAISPD